MYKFCKFINYSGTQVPLYGKIMQVIF